MKKFLAVLMAAAMTASLAVIPASAAPTEWKLGYQGEQPNKDQKQGENNFYFMFSTEINKGTKFPVNTFKECIKSKEVSWWPLYIKTTGGLMWSPDPKYLSKDIYDPDRTGKGGVEDPLKTWFLLHCESPKTDINDDGVKEDWKGYRINPGCDVTPAVKWVAPADGTYDVNAEIRGGIVLDVGVEYDSTKMDPVLCSVYHESKMLYNKEFKYDKAKDTTEKLEKVDVNKTVTMKKGEAIYFITDPQKYNWGDNSYWSMTIKSKGGTTTTPGGGNTTPSNSSTGTTPTPGGNTNSTTTSGGTGSVATGDVSGTGTESVEASSDFGDNAIVDADWDDSSEVTSSESEKAASNAWIWIVVAVVAVVLIAGGVVGFILYKKKSAKTDS